MRQYAPEELFSLEGKVALVTGANRRGLGRAIALGLREAGATVAVTGRDAAKNAEIAEELGDPGAVFQLDVRDEEGVAATMHGVVDRFGRLDVLVNNAGVASAGPLFELSLERWRETLDTHLTGSYLCSKHAGSLMATGGGGAIINIGSMYSQFGPPRAVDYATAKAGILGLTRALAVELAPFKIRANAILPGWFKTDLNRSLISAELEEEIVARTPCARLGVPDDLVGTAVFLASPASRFVTGALVAVDGGYLIADRLRRPFPPETTTMGDDT